MVIGAGLLTGLLRVPDPASVIIALLAGALVLGRPGPIALAVIASLAITRGIVLRRASASGCAAVLPLGETEMTIHTVDPGSGTGRVRVVTPRCAGPLIARWPATVDLPAGVDAAVTARWRPRPAPLGRPGGTLSVRAVQATTGAPGPLAKSRTAVAATIRRRFGADAAMVEALLTGRRGGLDRTLTEAFAAAGLVHVLAISGLHVGLLVGSLVLFLGALGVPRRRLRVLAAAVALGYAAWLGWPPPATRAAVLVVLAVVMRWRQRSVRSSGLIGASAVVVMLIDPWAIARVGAWLSFAAITGVVWATGWITSWQTRCSTLRDAVAASVGATLATAPIAALVLGRVAMIGPLLNLVAIPLVALAVPAAMAAVLLDPFSSGMAAAFAESARWLLAGLTQLARLGSRLPGAATSTTTGAMAALPWLVALMVAWLSTRGRSTPAEAFRRGGWGLCLMLWLPLLTSGRDSPPESGRLTLHFLDVGQGDAIAIESPAGRWLLVDAGPADGRWDAGERVVVPSLQRMGVRRIEALLLTHPHRDHVGGALALIEAMPIGIVLDPAEPFGERGYLDLLAELDARRLRWQPVAAGQSWHLDGVSFRILHPGGDWPGRGADLNEDSVVLEVRFGSFTALLTGDAGLPAEVAYLPQAEAIDLLKVGHHGSRGATGERLLAALAPAVAVISSGRNRYGHPAPEVLARLAQYQVETWRTDREGSISVVTDGRSFTVRGGRHVATFDADELNPGDTPCCTQPR